MADDDARETEDRQASEAGHDSAEGKAAQREESDPAAGGTGGSDDDASASEKAKQKEEEREEAKETMKSLEENPPEKLEDWPDDAAKYETFGGPEGEQSYDEAVTSKLGPSSLRHHEDGKVTVEGDEVDNPDEYKGEPIPGGPTDPDAPKDSTTKRVRGDDDEDEDEDEDGESKEE